MSSRVRLMLQDYANNSSLMGQRAFLALQGLYAEWAKAQKSQRRLVHVWTKVTEAYANAHVFNVTLIPEPPAGDLDFAWDGPGYYTRTTQTVSSSAAVPPLPDGPKWAVALAMWERLAPGLSGRYNLFVSRDNRRQSWRRSLCNPFYQGWGYALKPPRPKKKPKAKKASPGVAPGRGREFTVGYVDDLIGRVAQATAPTGPPPKPRVGIWT